MKKCIYCGKPARHAVTLILQLTERVPGTTVLPRFERVGGVVYVCAEHVQRMAVFVDKAESRHSNARPAQDNGGGEGRVLVA
jgi:hypothetical protein